MVLLIIITVALSAALLNLGLSLRTAKRHIRELEQSFALERTKIRKDAQFRSSAVNWGLSIENFVPFMDEFPIPAEAINFLGKPIDYVGFTDTHDAENCKVHIIEVKSGRSQLSKHQRNIKKAVKQGRVEWHEVRVKANAERER
jgi:predicted Holliday junction resolvase-like endonuclease